MGSFAHPMHYFAAAGENDDFVIAVINFQLNQYDWKLLCYLFGFHQCFTIFLPMFHQGFTTASLVSHLCLKSVFEVFKILTDSEDYENNPFKDSCPCAVS